MRRGLVRGLAAFLVVLGCLLVPVAATAWWTKGTVSDSDRFVSTVAPVATDPAVQQLVEDQLVGQVMAWVDEQQVAKRSIEALVDQGVSPRVAASLALLAEPLRDRLEQRVQRAAERVVESEEFVTALEGSLGSVHEQLVAIVLEEGDDADLITASDDGTLRLSMATLTNTVRAQLVEAGVEGAERLPEVTATIPIAKVEQLVTIRKGYRVLDALATWLPVLAVALLVGGVLLGRRRGRWALGAGVGAVLALLLTLVGLMAARTAVVDAVPGAPEAARAAVDLVSEPLRSLLRGLGAAVLAVVLVTLAVVTVRDRPEVMTGAREAWRRASRSPLFPVAAGVLAALGAVVLLVAELRPGAMLLVLALTAGSAYAAWQGAPAHDETISD